MEGSLGTFELLNTSGKFKSTGECSLCPWVCDTSLIYIFCFKGINNMCFQVFKADHEFPEEKGI
jgi:hypothetical protein